MLYYGMHYGILWCIMVSVKHVYRVGYRDLDAEVCGCASEGRNALIIQQQNEKCILTVKAVCLFRSET